MHVYLFHLTCHLTVKKVFPSAFALAPPECSAKQCLLCYSPFFVQIILSRYSAY